MEIKIDNDLLDLSFKGILSSDTKRQVIEFVTFLKNNGKENVSLYIESEDVLKLKEFSNGIIYLLKELGMVSYPVERSLSLFFKRYLIMKPTNCIVINAIEEGGISSNDWGLLKQNLKDSQMLTVYLTNKKSGKLLREKYSNEFYNTFDYKIELEPYSILEIVSGANYVLKNSGLVYDENTFLPAYDEWVQTVYHRADLQGEAFVFGLLDRLIHQSKQLNQERNITVDTIPRYWKRELFNAVKGEIEDKFSDYTDVKRILKLVQNNQMNKASRKDYNLIIKAEDYSVVNQFAKAYGRLLNAKDYDVIYSKITDTKNIKDFIELHDLYNKHGLMFVDGLDELNDDSNASHVIESFLANVSNVDNDLVWVVYTKNADNALIKSIQDEFCFFQFKKMTSSKIELSKQEYDIGESIQIHVLSDYQNYSHKLYVKWDGKEERVAFIESGNTSFKYIYQIPACWANDLSDKQEGVVLFKLDTYLDDRFIGSYTTEDIRIKVPDSYTPVIEKIMITNEDGSGLNTVPIIKNKSKLKFKIQIGECCGSKIKSVKTYFEDEEFDGDEFVTNPLKNGGKIDYRVEVVDSRNRVAVKEGKVKIDIFSVHSEDFIKVQEKEKQLGELVKNIEDDSDEKTVLLLAMSTLPGTKGVSKYIAKNVNVEGLYVSQLEPVPKILVEVLARNKKKLDYIYVLNTQETIEDKAFLANTKVSNEYYSNELDKKYTAFEYFIERCSSFINPEHIVNIYMENKNESVNVSQALYDFTNQLGKLAENSKVNLYVDIHGGLRDSFTVVDSILMLMKNMHNVNLVDMYSAKQNRAMHEYQIDSVKNTFNVYDFVGGMHEFLSFGRSYGLEKYNAESDENNEDKEKEKCLVGAINKFSSDMSLNRVEHFSNNLESLSNKVNSVTDKGYFGTVKQLITKNYLVNLNKIECDEVSEYDLLGNGKNYLPAQLKWCLDKGLLQQALTLIESKVWSELRAANIFVNKNSLRNDRHYYRADDRERLKNKNDKECFDNWITRSLLDMDIKYGYNEITASVYPKNVHIKIPSQRERGLRDSDLISYFTVDDTSNYFSGIEFDTKEQVLQSIHEKKSMSHNRYKYYQSCSQEESENACGNKLYICKNNGNHQYYYIEEAIPLNPNMLTDCETNEAFIENLHILLFIHKGLKKYRNTVSHALDETEESTMGNDTLEKWLRLYVEQLDRVLRDGIQILSDAN